MSKDGEIQAMEIDVLSGAGAYSQYPRTSVFEANQILNITGGPYKHKHYRAKATVVYLNKVPTSQYRAVGHPIGNSVGESLVDMAAEATGLDPVEIRRRNVMPDDGYPVTSAGGIRLKDLSHQHCLELLVKRMNYDALRQEQAELRKKGIYRGIGVAAFIKGTAPGPHGYYGMGGAPIASQDACTIKLEPGGGIICAVGVTEQGQGVDTVMGQIAASVLGVPMEQVRVISGDTDATPYGGGTYASRATAIGGEAVFKAAHDLRAEILSIAGTLLQASPVGARHRRRQRRQCRRHHAAHLARRDRAHQSFPARRTAQQRAAGAVGDAALPPARRSLHLHQRHQRLLCRGRCRHRLLPPAQALGGGGLRPHHQSATWPTSRCAAAACRDSAAGFTNTASTTSTAISPTPRMADYLTPMAGEMPDIDVAHVSTFTTASELGAKGVGESGTASAPAVAMNAVNDALRPFGARVFEQPMTPEVILRALGKV